MSDNWGGQRSGSGRKVEKFTLRRGQKYGLARQTRSGQLPLAMVTVTDVDRKAITLETEDGQRFIIFR